MQGKLEAREDAIMLEAGEAGHVVLYVLRATAD